MAPAQATYLAWLDFRARGLSNDELSALVFERARIVVNEGHIFGAEGDGFARLNVACPRPVLQTALERLTRAMNG